jgi:hypothetical protein
VSEETPEPTPPPPPRKRRGWLRRGRIDLGDAAVQFIAVVVGIVLGLFINQWVAQRQQQYAVHQAMHAIRVELAANRAILHKNAEHWHDHVMRVIDSSKNVKPSPRPCYLWPGWTSNHTEVAPVSDAAYQTAIATRAMAHMPFQQAHRVAQIYSHQQQGHDVQTFLVRHFLLSGRHTLHLCVSVMESFDRNYQLLSAKYAPLIGPDKTKWPTPPSVPPKPSTIPK